MKNRYDDEKSTLEKIATGILEGVCLFGLMAVLFFYACIADTKIETGQQGVCVNRAQVVQCK